jgi:SAM-dependent methyltransferase
VQIAAHGAGSENMKRLEYAVKGLRAPLYRALNRHRRAFDCPVCGYHGPFMDKRERLDAKCPRCGEVERSRLQYLVTEQLIAERCCTSESALHIAPENAMRQLLRKRYGTYVSADLKRNDVDRRFDVQAIPFPDESFDLVFASYVLEYAEHDRTAMREIQRVLRPGGLAILPVPLMYRRTEDLPSRDPRTGHMHNPGMDYLERFREVFPALQVFTSDDFPGNHQLLTFRGLADRDHALYRGDGWHAECVPVCFV